MIPKHATVVAYILVFIFFGCSRKVDPETADMEVRKLLQEVPGFDWAPADSSRLAYIENNDELPVPPKDDNDSRLITLRIQKSDAYEDGNESLTGEKKDWEKSLPVDGNGTILLDLETAMSLAILHSRDYQLQKEALYLSALDVTYERFQLGPLPFAGISGQVSQEIDEDPSDFQSRAQAGVRGIAGNGTNWVCLLYTSPSPRDTERSRMPSSA